MNGSKKHAVVFMFVMALVVAGCGSSSVSSNSIPGGANSIRQPIKIGFICSCTGAFAASIAMGPPAYQAWVSSVNAQGGINGHKVQLFIKDDALNPGTSLSEVETLVSQDHVVALVDGSDVDASWADFVLQQNIPVIGSGTSSQPFYTNPDFFAEGQTEDQLFASIVGAAKKVNAKTMALLYCAEATVCQEGVAPLKTTASALGVPLVYNASISASAPNFTAQCLAAKQSGASALFIADAVTVVQTVAADCAQQGYTPQVIIDGMSLAPGFSSSPGLNKNTVFEMPNIPYFVASPGVATMNAAFRKYEVDLLKSKNFNEIAVQGWVSGLLFEAAAKAGQLGVHGAPMASELVTGLHTLKATTLGGMAPPLTFVAGKANPVDCWLNYAVLKDGLFSMPFGQEPICAAAS